MPKYGAAPAPFIVLQDWKPKKRGGGEPHTSRMGGYLSLKEAKDAIVRNEREMSRPNSYGGLVDWGDDDGIRHYRIYKAEYEEIN